MSGGHSPHSHSEDDLLEQWDFLDSMAERQAASLRAGIQDSEEVDAAPAPGDPAAQRRIAELEVQVAMLHEAVEKAERERDGLGAQVAAISDENTRLREQVSVPAQVDVLTAADAALLRQHADDVQALARRLRTELDTQRDAFRARIAALEAQNAAIRAAHDREVEAVRAAHAQVLTLQRRLSELRATGTQRRRWRRDNDPGSAGGV